MQFLQIENKAAKVKLDEVVHKDSMDTLIDEISKVFGAQAFESGLIDGEITNCIENAADTLDIDIHSPGGSVIDGYVLYNELMDLRERGVYVTAYITLAASMASVIAMAADKIVMKRGGRMMIHEASAGIRGNAEQIRQQAELLESISDEIAGIYADRTKLLKEEVRDMMKKETWMSAEEAISMGFADESFDTKPNNSMSILDRITKPSSDEALERISALEASIESHDGQLAEFQAKAEQAEAALQEAATELEAIKNEKELAEALNCDLEAKVSELESKIVALTEEAEAEKAEVAEKVEELEAKAEITEEKVSARASEILASQGHPAPVALNEDEELSVEDIKAEFAKMKPGAERSAFFQAHKDVLSIKS